MKQKLYTTQNQGHSTNMLLAAGAPETETKHGHKGFGIVSALSGLCVGATSRPILFSPPMVKAILKDFKTQTRRVVKNQSDCNVLEYGHDWEIKELLAQCPYGKVGDKLWVRETWWKRPFLTSKDLRDGADTWPKFEYETEKLMAWNNDDLRNYGWKRMPSIFMPREACRIELTITGIRIERLNEISESDSLHEGITSRVTGVKPFDLIYQIPNSPNYYYSARQAYSALWANVNGKESWKENPFVWVIEFQKTNDI